MRERPKDRRWPVAELLCEKTVNEFVLETVGVLVVFVAAAVGDDGVVMIVRMEYAIDERPVVEAGDAAGVRPLKCRISQAKDRGVL